MLYLIITIMPSDDYTWPFKDGGSYRYPIKSNTFRQKLSPWSLWRTLAIHATWADFSLSVSLNMVVEGMNGRDILVLGSMVIEKINKRDILILILTKQMLRQWENIFKRLSIHTKRTVDWLILKEVNQQTFFILTPVNIYNNKSNFP